MTERNNSDKNQRSYRWTDTQLVGSLKVSVLSEVCGIPLAIIRMHEAESDELIFEYELPLNFNHSCDTTDPTFYCIKCGTNDQYFGFKLTKASDQARLVQKMKQLANLLRKNRHQLRELKNANPSDVTIDHIELPTQLDEIFGS
jgi:hypothetical protein